MSFTIDPDITLARTPPGSLYGDPALHARAREAIFRRSWQIVGDTDDVKVPGQCTPLTLLESLLDEPLLLTRDRDDQVHCLSNVCTHRGTILCEHGGVQKNLTCRYHGRRFDLDGTFRHMPEFEGVQGFPSQSDNLPRVAHHRWGPLLFASLDPATPFDDWLGPVRERLTWLPIDDFRREPSRDREYLVRANWALYVDNYLEGFHIPFVHASLNQSLDYGQYSVELFPHANLQLGVARPGEPMFDLPPSSPDHGRPVAAYYFWLFPNTMLNFYPWGLSVNIVRPLAIDRTRVSFLGYVWDESRLGEASILDRVEREDEAVVEAEQRGLRSSLYTRGRYSPAREQGVHHFHRMLAAGLFGVG